MRDPKVVPARDGPVSLGPGGSQAIAKLVSSDTGGAFSLAEYISPPGDGPPLHRHSREDETFWILEGEVTFCVGAGDAMRVFVAGPGTTVFGPRGVAHTFRNRTQTPARFLLLVSPPENFERFYARMGARHADGRAPTPEEIMDRIGRFAPEHGLEILGDNPL